jgi:hypothetical protein
MGEVYLMMTKFATTIFRLGTMSLYRFGPARKCFPISAWMAYNGLL